MRIKKILRSYTLRPDVVKMVDTLAEKTNRNKGDVVEECVRKEYKRSNKNRI